MRDNSNKQRTMGVMGFEGPPALPLNDILYFMMTLKILVFNKIIVIIAMTIKLKQTYQMML